jgi:hypothetical protein
MLISQTNETSSINAVTGNAVQQAVRTKMLDSSVKLTGTPTSGGGTFTGSAVILYEDGGTVTLVTAKHSLFIFDGKKDPPTWSDQLVADFQANVTINYGAGLADNSATASTAPAPLARVTPVNQGAQSTWTYDVMILESTDAGLVTHAQTRSLYPSPPTYTPQVGNVLANATQYLSKSGGNLFVQTGYGNATDKAENTAETPMSTAPKGTNTGGNLQYKTSIPKAEALAVVYNQKSDKTNTYFQYVDAIRLDADPNSSTAPGDSGGGLFLITSVQVGNQKVQRALLIGVTTGSDMDMQQVACPKPPAILTNNILTSLQYCYTNNLLGY